MFCKWCGEQMGEAAVCPACGERRAAEPASQRLKVFFMEPVLEAISRGRFFRNGMSSFLRVTAVLQAVAALGFWFLLWKAVFKLDGVVLFGGLLFQVVFPIGLYMIVHTQLIRARDVAELPDSDFTVIPISSILLRLAGEQYAILISAGGVGGFFLLLFSSGLAGWERPDLGLPIPYLRQAAAAGFVGAVLFLVVALSVAVAVLFLFYFLAEALLVFVQIARNTQVTKEVALQYDRRNAGVRG